MAASSSPSDLSLTNIEVLCAYACVLLAGRRETFLIVTTRVKGKKRNDIKDQKKIAQEGIVFYIIVQWKLCTCYRYKQRAAGISTGNTATAVYRASAGYTRLNVRLPNANLIPASSSYCPNT